MADEGDPSHTGYQDKQTRLCFDPRVGEYTRVGMQGFATRDQGYLVRYRGPEPELELIDIYLYGQGVPDIPEGTEADAIMGSFAQILGNLEQVVADGKYCDYEVLVTERVTFGIPPSPSVEILHAAVTCRQGPASVDPDLGMIRAHFFLRGFRGRLFKIRFTHRIEGAERAEARFFKFFGEFIAQFQAGH